jgi:hypothetical protein
MSNDEDTTTFLKSSYSWSANDKDEEARLQKLDEDENVARYNQEKAIIQKFLNDNCYKKVEVNDLKKNVNCTLKKKPYYILQKLKNPNTKQNYMALIKAKGWYDGACILRHDDIYVNGENKYSTDINDNNGHLRSDIEIYERKPFNSCFFTKDTDPPSESEPPRAIKITEPNLAPERDDYASYVKYGRGGKKSKSKTKKRSMRTSKKSKRKNKKHQKTRRRNK